MAAFTQFKFGYKKIDFYLAQSFTSSIFQRDGKYKNGYYPMNSFGKSKMKMWTEDYLKAFSHYKPIENFSMDPVPKVLENKSIILKLSDVRKTSQPQLWVSGCSFAAGDGVQSNQRYGQILSDRLNLPVSFLAESGSSVTWAADQILRSDLRENDILIWGLTSIPRINYFKNNKVHHVFPGPCEHIKNFQKILVDSEEDILYWPCACW
jgi:hypothetical protein